MRPETSERIDGDASTSRPAGMTTTLYWLVLAALALSLLHHVDHVLRDDAGWPLNGDVNVFTYSLGIYPIILTGLVLSALGRVGPRFWAFLSLGGALFVGGVHAGPVATDAITAIPGSYRSPVVGWLAVVLLVALVAVLAGTFGYEIRLSTARRGSWDLREVIRRHRLVAFVVVAFGYSWAWWLPLTLAGTVVDFGAAVPTYLAGAVGPLVAALVVTGLTEGRAGLRDLLGRIVRWRVAPRWYGIAVLIPLALFAVAATIVAATGGPWPTPAELGVIPGLPAAGVLVIWAYLVVIAGVGEEAGWRGYALPHLQDRYSPLVATGLLSLLWAGWHLPVVPVLTSLATVSSPAMLPLFWFGMACLSVVLTWIYHRSGGSILLAALWHGTYNLAAGTAAAQYGINTIFTVLVMAWAGGLVVMEVRARRACRAAESPLAVGPAVSRTEDQGRGGVGEADGRREQGQRGW